MYDMNGKTAVITGAGGYIGSAVARALAADGVKAAVCDINTETAQKTVDAIRASGGTAECYAIDVTRSESVDAVFAAAAAVFGGVDISIHVAGGSARIAGPDAKYVHLTEQTDSVIETVLGVNLLGALYVSRAAARQMKKQGNGGRIINFSSIVGKNGLRTCVDYAAAKGGVMGFTPALAKELGEYGITVNSVAPGVVSRPKDGPDGPYELETNFLHKKCMADDVADLVSFLVSEKARFITGQTYIIDGGRSLAMLGTDWEGSH